LADILEREFQAEIVFEDQTIWVLDDSLWRMNFVVEKLLSHV